MKIYQYNNVYTIVSEKPGGAIINHKNKNVAIEEWKKGMKLAEFVKKTFLYNKLMKVKNLN